MKPYPTNALPGLWRVALVALLGSLAACNTAPESSPPPTSADAVPAVVAPQPAAPATPVPAPISTAPAARASEPYPVWLAALRTEALARGLRAETFDIALSNVTLSQRVIDLDRAQPEVKASYMSYLRNRLTGVKIANAQQALRTHQSQLSSAVGRYGVPASVIVGIWGMETNFGSFTGNFPVMQALASLAYDGRRSAMFREELFAALQMLDRGDATLGQMRGSWAGAFGQPQFMPSSYLRYAVDGDGNGDRDIWNSLPDVFASIGNYLQQAGWKAGEGWGLAVAPPAGFDPASVANAVEPTQCKAALRKHSIAKSIGDWKALGFVPNGTSSWPADESLATLVQPDGPDGPSFLTLPNYRAILSYNCSNFYALSVLLLADAAAQ